MVFRIAAGCRLSTAEKLSTTALVVALSILANTTNPVVRSTSVPTDERLPAPLIKIAFPMAWDEAILDLWRPEYGCSACQGFDYGDQRHGYEVCALDCGGVGRRPARVLAHRADVDRSRCRWSRERRFFQSCRAT